MFKLAIIGRANVGKSSLFNALSGKKIALTNDTPGLSRDRKESTINLLGMHIQIVDTGGYDNLEDIMNRKIWEQAEIAISEADSILFMLDGKSGLSPVDKHLANLLRKTTKPVVVAINKCDAKEFKDNLPLFFELGYKNMVHLSATHKTGLHDLYEGLLPYYEEYMLKNPTLEDSIKPEITMAFVGKPNVGKSTIINTIIQQNRLITNDEAGTTRDAVYLDFMHKDKKIKIIDTAGLRKKSKVEEESIERISNSDSIKAINFATIVGLVISAESGLTKQDLKIAKHIVDEGRGLIVIVNKIDLVNKKQQFLNAIAEQVEQAFFQIKKPYVVGVSALKDKKLDAILDIALILYTKWQFRIPTSKLNLWLNEAVQNSEPPSISGRRLKVKYISQAKSRPPTINIWSNQKEKFPTSYLRYLQNEFYKSFDLWGCTIRFNIKKSENPYDNKKL